METEWHDIRINVVIILILFMKEMEEVDPSIVEAYLAHKKNQAARAGRGKKLTPEQADVKRKRLWVSIAKKEIPKVRP